ncbi:MAG: hypothetical protein ABH885_06735 [Candidatus Omnitrophota bacterium]
MLRTILHELRHHAPFTMFGALTGVVAAVIFKGMPHETAQTLFCVFHPAHVFLSAIVTASMYNIYKYSESGKRNIWLILLIGYVGSVGIATLSDCLIPYAGESILKMPDKGMHLGFIEEWYIVNPAAIAGILLAYFWPRTKFPHAGHVLLSTWASLFHILMAAGKDISLPVYAGIFVFLFLSVWLPCCVSDIVFPLLFVGRASGHHMHEPDCVSVRSQN